MEERIAWQTPRHVSNKNMRRGFVPWLVCSLLLALLQPGYGAARAISTAPSAGPTITEFRSGISAGRSPAEIVAGPDGNLWFTEYAGDAIGRITPSGVVTEFSSGIAPNSGPLGIASGPDGNLWFTEYSGNRIGRITTQGVITEYPLANGSSPAGIAAGPNGNLWFTVYHGTAGGWIGQITPSGTITETLIRSGYPYAITLGPDGNVWFTGFFEFGEFVAHAGPSGAIQNGYNPTFLGVGIASGPDGQIWLTGDSGPPNGQQTGQVWSLSMSGALSLASTLPCVPMATVTNTSGATLSPQGIVDGPDTNLWSTCGSGSIVRITTSGSITQFTTGITSGANPQSIAVGSDGNLWFTEAGSAPGTNPVVPGGIGRITLNVLKSAATQPN